MCIRDRVYSDLVATDNSYLTRGTSQTLTITSGTYAPDHYSAWIDYDQDLIFEESERLGAFTTATAGEVCLLYTSRCV